MRVRVLSPGAFATVQAEPRVGVQDLGIGASGPMDPRSHRLANLLVGNAADAATVEVMAEGAAFRFERDLVIALCGADQGATLDGLPAPLNRPLAVAEGVELALPRQRTGRWTYLAVAGGISVPKVLGSRATDLRTALGGVEGRCLKAGDRLWLGGGGWPWPRLRPGREAFVAADWEIAVPAWEPEPVLGVVAGPHVEVLTEASRRAFLEETFRMPAASTRQGALLEGPALELRQKVEILSAGVTFGTLQLPPEQRPYLLMAERQSTGGYPRLGDVASVDLGAAAQVPVGGRLRFRLETVGAARELAWREAQWIASVARDLETRRWG